MSDSDDIVEEIRSKLSPLETLASPKHANRSGFQVQGCHPIHGALGKDHSDAESNNFSINTKKQVWHCFAHDSGGDVFSWIAVEEGLVKCEDASNIADVFGEVLEIAAERAGVDLDVSDDDKERYKKTKKKKEELEKAFEVAQGYFRENLTDEIREWIKQKYGFSDEVIDKYGLGYAPLSDNGLLKKLEKDVGTVGYETGLVLSSANPPTDLFQGRVTFPYYKHGKVCYYIARKTPWTPDDIWQQGKYIKQQVGSSKKYVSEYVENHLYGLDSIRGESEVIVTEGITDAISVMELGYPCISPITVRFKQNDIEKIKRVVRGKKIYVCNDADEAGFKGALDTLEKIVGSWLVLLESGDLNDFYHTHEKEDFDRLLKKAVPREEALALYRSDLEYIFIATLEDMVVNPYRLRKVWDKDAQQHIFYSIWDLFKGIDNMRDAVGIFRRTEKTDARTPTALEEGLRPRLIAGAIKRHLLRHGKFLYDKETDKVFYFSEKDNEVFGIDSPQALAYYEEKYDLNKTTSEGKFTIEKLELFGKRQGEEVSVKKYFYYNGDSNKLYIHNRNHHYYVLDGKSVEIKPNGEGVYFETLRSKKIDYLPPGKREYPPEVFGQIDTWHDQGSFLHKVMVNRTNFASKTALTADQQRLQHLVTVYMFPFGSFFRGAKPIIAYIGEKGSGKSVTMKMIAKFLTNPNYELAAMPDEQDFYVAAYNNPLYFLDNVDKSKKWLNDAIAAIATGVAIKQRQLFTNFIQAEAKIDCFLGMNARDPQFKRDDVVDRLLIFYVDRISDNLIPEHLFGPIEKHWNTLWSEYIDDLNSIVKAFTEVDTSKMKSTHRLVEWVCFAQVVQRALGIDKDEMQKLIRDMKYEKSAFSLEGDPLLNALYVFIEENYHAEGRWYGAKDLYGALSDIHEEFAGAYKTSLSLAKRLPNVQSELGELIGLKQRFNKHKHHNEYTFSGEVAGLDRFGNAPSDDEGGESKSLEGFTKKENEETELSRIEMIRGVINDFEEDEEYRSGVPIAMVKETCKRKYKLSAEEVDKEVERMLDSGILYSPRFDHYGVA